MLHCRARRGVSEPLQPFLLEVVRYSGRGQQDNYCDRTTFSEIFVVFTEHELQM